MTPEAMSKCCDCEGINRRQFVQTAAAAAAAAAVFKAAPAAAAPSRKSDAEVAVREFYESLDEGQRKIMALPMDDARRTRISANWSITPAKISDFRAPQQELIQRVIRGITSEDGYERFTKQMKDDWGDVGRYSIAIFGDPQQEVFEFELTGRHLTLRADGNTIPGPAFGGPIIYGHAKPGNSSENLFFYQTLQANEVFEMLDAEQRKQALLPKAPAESAVQLREAAAERPGLAGKALAADQKQLVMEVLADILRPYRKEDVDEAMQVLKAGGGVDSLNVSFYQNGDLGDDKIWDIWRLEGPTLVCHFRGAPHVHAYINCAKKA